MLGGWGFSASFLRLALGGQGTWVGRVGGGGCSQPPLHPAHRCCRRMRAITWTAERGFLSVSPRCGDALTPRLLPMPLGNRASVTVLMLLLVLSWVFVRFVFLHLSPRQFQAVLSRREHYFKEVPGDLSSARLSTKKLAGRVPVKSS